MDSKDFFSKEDIYNDVLLYSYQNPVKHIDENDCYSLTKFFRNYWVKERGLDAIWRMMPPGLKTEGRRGQTRPSDGEKMPENNEWNLGVPKSSDGECFYAEKNLKGKAIAHWATSD